MTPRCSIDPADTDGGMAAAAAERETTTISPAVLEAALVAAIKDGQSLTRERDEAREEAASLSRQLADAQRDADMSRTEMESEQPRPGTKPYLSVSFSGLDVDLRVAQWNGPELPSASVDRADVLQALVTMTDVVREEMVEDGRTIPAWAARPFPPDGITDQFVDDVHQDYFWSTEDRVRLEKPALRHALLDAVKRLQEPPRPEWADIEDVLNAGWPEGINGAENGYIARTLHEGGVRVVTEEER